MTSRDEAIRRALCALRDEIAGAEHPGHEILEAYVDGTLTPAQRADVDRLAARSQVVAEDLADLQAIHETLVRQPAAKRDIRWGRIAAIAAVAASIVAAIWISASPSPPLATIGPKFASGEQESVQRAITDGRLTLSAEALALRGKQGTLLGSQDAAASLRPLSPVGTMVRESRPAFRWSDGGADAYSIAIFDERFNEVMRSPRIAATSWTPDRELNRETTYVWQVTAYRGARSETEPKPPRPEARFIVASAPKANDAASTIVRLHDEPLALGIILAQTGFVDEGRAALERAAGDPSTADTAQRLLASLDQGTPITTKPAQ